MSAPNEEQSHDGDWGWEPLGSEDEEPQNTQAVIVHGKNESGAMDADGKSASLNKHNSSDKSLSAKRGSFTGQKSLPGIVSSPSFLELEKAIGATLNLASNDSGDLGDNRLQSPTTTFPPSRLSSTNLTQQKVNQQRLRQQQHQGQRYSSQNQYSRSPAAGPYSYNTPNGYAAMPPPMPQLQLHSLVPARIELAPFINEGESRAIILFHSVHVSAADIRNACSKHGVLYYIRPEFHGKGVTLISYFDLRAASTAKACIAEDLGRSAEASAHYSVMLHAANGNSEEFRLVVRNLPAESCGEAEVESIFARYGQLRSIQKTFEQKDATLPSSPSSGAGGKSETERDSIGGGLESKGENAGEETNGDTAAAGDNRDNNSASPDDTATATVSATANSNDNCKIAYSIEYYNIQDARLAASELSATSSQLWNTDVTVKFAPLDERKQQLCRQLLATLSRWRSEMAALVTSSAAAAAVMSYNFMHQQHQQLQQQQGYGITMSNMGMMGVPAAALGMGVGVGLGYNMAQQQQGLGLGAAMGLPAGSGMDGSPYYDPTNAYYQQQQQHQHQQMYLQQHQQQVQQYMASAAAAESAAAAAATNASPGTFDSTNGGGLVMQHQLQQQQQQGMPMPMSVQAMAGLMYATTEGVGGAASRASPMQSLMPANLSNPNLFNLGLLAAQAEAQMQQQHQQQQHQQMLVHQQQQQLPQDTSGDGVRDVDPQSSGARPGFHQYQQQSGYVGAGSGGNRYGQQQQQQHHHQGNNGQRLQQQNMVQGAGGGRASVPPHHHHQHHLQQQHQNGGAFSSGAPLHHHQQHHLQMQYNNSNVTFQQQQQLQMARRGGKVPLGAGQYAYSPYPSTVVGGTGTTATGGAGGANGGRSGEGSQQQHQHQQQQQQHDSDFVLDLKRIGDDEETRTTVMVRNIPNKYNQQMLLEEVNVGHEGTYDFFYLPIDFKNRCNVGYCFINFLDPKHIPPFVHAFHGQRWKSFNSEKVCAVTFARIQGKQAMISRFQNSSLLEKDDEYQPLLFYSSGPDRGKPEPFPASNNARRSQQLSHQQQQQHSQQGASGGYFLQTQTQTSPLQSHSHSQVHSQSQSQSASPASTSRSITPPPPPSANGTPRSLHTHQQQQLSAPGAASANSHHQQRVEASSNGSGDVTGDATVPRDAGAA